MTAGRGRGPALARRHASGHTPSGCWSLAGTAPGWAAAVLAEGALPRRPHHLQAGGQSR